MNGETTVVIGEYVDVTGERRLFTEPKYVWLPKRSSQKHFREDYFWEYPLFVPKYQYLFQEEHRIISSLKFSRFVETFEDVLLFFFDSDRKDLLGRLYSYMLLSKEQVVNPKLLKKDIVDQQYRDLVVHYYRINSYYLGNVLNDFDVQDRLKRANIDFHHQALFRKFLAMMDKNSLDERFDEKVDELYQKIIRGREDESKRS